MKRKPLSAGIAAYQALHRVSASRLRRPARTLAAGLLAASLMAVGQVLAAVPDPCNHFAWDLSRELTLFQSAAITLRAGRDVDGAPRAELAKLYSIELIPEASVAFAVPPGGKRTVADAQAGIVTFTVPAAGHYRVSADAPLWIDIVAPEGVVRSSAFTGNPNCALIHKSVEFALSSDQRLVLQLSKASAAIVRVTVTPAPSAPVPAPSPH